MEEYTYHRGSQNSRETVEFDVMRRGDSITTCVVDVDMLICGIKAFPCGNGCYVNLTAEQQLSVLETVQQERKRITDSYPIKTLEGWRESGLTTFEDFCFPGDDVDDAMVEHFITSVPPALMWPSCMQAGEPHSFAFDEDYGRYRNTYTTFHKIKGGWIFDGYCFYAKNENRCAEPFRLQQLIDKLRRN